MGNPCGERGQCWDDHSNRRLNDHERRAARLKPNAVAEPIRRTGVIDNEGPPGQVAENRTSVRINMVVPVAGIAMLAVRLDLFFAVLRVYIRWVETGKKQGGEQEAKHSHGSSPLPGDMDGIRARPLVIRTTGKRDPRSAVDIFRTWRFRQPAC